MEFKNIEVKNFKQFSDLSITFQPGINILLGGNGVGKTSVLEALSIALSDYFNGIPNVPRKESMQIKFGSIHMYWGMFQPEKSIFLRPLLQLFV